MQTITSTYQSQTMTRRPMRFSNQTIPPKRSAQKMKLPNNFQPGQYAVICGRGKLCSSSPGNMHLRSLVANHLNAYSMAKNKAEKSSIVSAIINRVRELSPEGSFVKQEGADGEWWEVDDSFAREKIGCIFRDVLHTQYRSSTKAKHARKKAATRTAAERKLYHKSGATMMVHNKDMTYPGSWGSINQAVDPCVSLDNAVSNFPISFMASQEMSVSELAHQTTRTPSTRKQPQASSTTLFWNHDHGNNPVGGFHGKNDQQWSRQNMASNSNHQKTTSLSRPAVAKFDVMRNIRFDVLANDSHHLEQAGMVPSTSSSSPPGDAMKSSLSLLEDALGVLDDIDGTLEDDLADDLADIFDGSSRSMVW